jgi:hypothetical protein
MKKARYPKPTKVSEKGLDIQNSSKIYETTCKICKK